MSAVDEAALSAHKLRNKIHSALLLAGMGLILLISTVLIWGGIGIVWTALAIALLVGLGPRIPPEAVMRLYRARPLDPRLGGQLKDVAEALAQRAGLAAPPDIYVIPSMTLNAFAAGSPGRAVIGITEGLLRRLTMREIAGVLAHEVSHIRNDDLWIMGLADAMTRFAQALSYVGVFLAMLNLLGLLSGEQHASWAAVLLLYFAPALSSFMQLGLSRAREYDADLGGVLLTGDPLGLASALRRLERYTGRFWEDLMLPIPGRRVPQPSLLRSHPSTEERIERLLSLPPSPQYPAMVIQERPMISLIGVGPIEMRPRYRWPGLWF